MFGGPPTPAVGFGMGDVVLSLVLQDKGLMPSDAELMGIAGQWPDAFVISNGTPEADAAVPGVLASLRRGMSVQEREERKLGSESRPTSAPDYGLHARRSYKSTKNIGKLLQDAVKCNARFAVIVESATEATIKDIGTSVQDQNRPRSPLWPPNSGRGADIRSAEAETESGERKQEGAREEE